MELEVGNIYEGKVTGITKYGAFVNFEGGKSGLVHISEVANTFVSDVNNHVKLGQMIRVKVMSIGNDGKINLSIKRLEARPARDTAPRNNNFRNGPAPRRDQPQDRPQQQSQPRPAYRQPVQPAAPKTADQLFEEKLKAFMSESDSKISSIKQYSDHRTKSRRR